MSSEPGPITLAPRLDALEAAVRARSALVPRLALVLGSGLGSLAETIEDPVAIPFAELPGWPAASAPGHSGRLLLGHLEGVPVACLQGRLHMYEGLSALQVVEPALLMHRLGAGTLLLTNAAGGVNHAFPAGTLMLLSDHLNLTGRTPLIGPNDDAVGPRFLDLSAVYDKELRAAAAGGGGGGRRLAPRGHLRRAAGPDVRDARRRCACCACWARTRWACPRSWRRSRRVGRGCAWRRVSLVTNPGAGISATPLSHEEVLEAANEAGPRLARVIRGFVRDLPA